MSAFLNGVGLATTCPIPGIAAGKCSVEYVNDRNRRFFAHAAGVPVIAGALWFGIPAGGAMPTYHTVTYQGQTALALLAEGHDSGLHANTEYPYIYLPGGESGTATTISF